MAEAARERDEQLAAAADLLERERTARRRDLERVLAAMGAHPPPDLDVRVLARTAVQTAAHLRRRTDLLRHELATLQSGP